MEHWRHTLEASDFRVSRLKTEYLHCCFSGRIDAGREVTLDERPIPKVNKFKYLGSIIQQNGDIEENINQRIKVGQQKREYTSGVLVIRGCPLD